MNERKPAKTIFFPSTKARVGEAVFFEIFRVFFVEFYEHRFRRIFPNLSAKRGTQRIRRNFLRKQVFYIFSKNRDEAGVAVTRFERRALLLRLREKFRKQPAQYKLVVGRVDYAFVLFRRALQLREQVAHRPYNRARAEAGLFAAQQFEH